MNELHKTINALELAQIAWVVPDIEVSIKFLENSLGIRSFPAPQHMRAQDLKMTYYGKVEDAEWLTTQAFNGGTFIEIVQPLSGKSMFHDYLKEHPSGGTQHLAFRLPVADFEKVTETLLKQGFKLMGEVDHPIASMAFFDTYHLLGFAIEIMGITPDGYTMIRKMQS